MGTDGQIIGCGFEPRFHGPATMIAAFSANGGMETEMSERERDKGLDCLFLSKRQDAKLVNVKFFRGSSDVISEEEFRAEICAAVRRRESGEVRATEMPPRRKKPPVNLREMFTVA